MKTSINEKYQNTLYGKEADAILRSCVHCGFCTATCPTYQILGDELDSPRGRIYLIKQALEGEVVTRSTQLHLDRCLTCRSCETTCPSGVRYSRLLDIGRTIVDAQVNRPLIENFSRWVLRKIVPNKNIFSVLLKIGQWFSPLLPQLLSSKIPQRREALPAVLSTKHERQMLLLDGCVQPAVSPATNAAAIRLLDRLGIEAIYANGAGCCGAVSYHLQAHEEGLDAMRRNIDAWWSHVEAGAEAIIITASGCGAMVKEYGDLLSHDPAYAEKARHVSELCKDISEALIAEPLDKLLKNAPHKKYRVAFHSPCTLQHAQKITDSIESLLSRAGYILLEVEDSHLCCGSAGTYSIFQPKLSQQLLKNKISALFKDEPDYVVTANIGCQMHLQSISKLPVMHWVELLDESFVLVE